MLWIIIGIVLFMFLVLIHELGHFSIARYFRVKVMEFGIGIPPKVGSLGKDTRWTEYTINAIPLGGFVRLKGEDPQDKEDFNAPDSFISASLGAKILILLGGVAVNTLFAWVAFSISFTQGIIPINVLPDNMLAHQSTSYLMPSKSFLEEQGLLTGDTETHAVTIESVLPDSLAERSGMQAGDKLLSLNGQTVDVSTFGKELQKYIGQNIVLTYERGGQPQTLNFDCPADGCFLGIALAGDGKTLIGPIKFSGLTAWKMGLHEIKAQSVLTFGLLGTLGRNLLSFNWQRMSDSVNKLSGPVGIIKFGEMILQEWGIRLYLAFGGMISLALALFNVLPIPALDGGRILGVLVQHIWRFAPEKYFVIENYINLFFFVVLMGLGIYIILLDLIRFWGVSIPRIG